MGGQGARLMQMLSAGLGEAFTPEVREAWTTMYGHVAKTMQQCANEPQALAA